jgi:hypothetical protein
MSDLGMGKPDSIQGGIAEDIHPGNYSWMDGFPGISGYPGKSPWMVIQRQVYRIPRSIPIFMPKSASHYSGQAVVATPSKFP